MRFLSMIRVQENTGKQPSERMMSEMGKLMTEMKGAGKLLDTAGLAPTAKSKRVRLRGGKISVVDGPFTETKELVAGFWIWQVKSMDEAVEWARRIPNPDNADGEIEIRPVFTDEDFGAALTPDIRDQAERLRARTEGSSARS